jgi:hypothetical protein
LLLKAISALINAKIPDLYRVFEDIKPRKLEAENDAIAIKTFKRRYREGTDDGGWRLTSTDNPDKILASTEPEELEENTTVNYMTYVR